MSETKQYMIERRKGPDKGKWNLDESELSEWLDNGKLLPMDVIYDVQENSSQYVKNYKPEAFTKSEGIDAAKRDIPEPSLWDYMPRGSKRPQTSDEVKRWSELSTTEKIFTIIFAVGIGAFLLFSIGYTIYDPSYLIEAFSDVMNVFGDVYSTSLLVRILFWVAIVGIVLLLLLFALGGILWLFVHPIAGPIIWFIIGLLVLLNAYNQVGGWITAALALSMWAISVANRNGRQYGRIEERLGELEDKLEDRFLELDDRIMNSDSSSNETESYGDYEDI